ncbi:hypothetical protein [Streptomyces sp. NBC_00986]|uniref:hypothetical protein n=1 Tax=Streptomyces sp. NBC_00986 TaxID=2903702 RepID=UPI003863256B|nr:hypothetical protein OG504_22035 [Streptomyces sp. NBC_00986]
MSTNASTRMNQNADTTPAELRRRLVDAQVSVPRESRVRAAAAIQGARAARNVCARTVRHWE